MSTIKVNTLDTRSGTTITVTAGKTLAGTDIIDTTQIAADAVTATELADNAVVNASVAVGAAIANSKMASDTTDASNISSGTLAAARMGSGTASATTVLYGDGSWKAEPVTDVAGLKEDIALLAFKTQANGSLARYGLADQVVDSFEDTSGIDLSGSTNEIRNTGSYIIGGTAGSSTTTKLTSGTSWTVPAGVYNAEVFIVAGGAGGGSDGGGGAGGVVHDTNHVLTAGASVTYAIGAAGTGGTYGGASGNGGNTTFSTLVAVGGGGGGVGGGPSANKKGQDGGCGGGSFYSDHPWTGGTSTQQTAGTPTGGTITSYGTNGGKGWYYNSQYMGGGGGGATQEGQIPRTLPTRVGGDGGDGIFSDIETPSADNNMGYYAAGGGGSYNHSYPGAYGIGGSQAGGGRDSGGAGGDGGDATGQAADSDSPGSAGGGADSQASSTGGAGAAGVALIKYTPITEAALTLVSNATEAVDAVTKGDIVMTYSDGVGTTSLNTDLTAEISADDGSTWTSVTLASQGTTAGHTIVTANEVTITSTISSPADMRYRIKTINQAASKQTRVHAVSLGWS